VSVRACRGQRDVHEGERADLLGLAVFEQREVFLGQSGYEIPALVSHHGVDVDVVDLHLECDGRRRRLLRGRDGDQQDARRGGESPEAADVGWQDPMIPS